MLTQEGRVAPAGKEREMSGEQDRTPTPLRRILRAPSLFAVVVAALFFSLGLATVLQHELWRDELEAWLVGKDNPSLGAMFRTVRYTGHPVLWYTCLHLISRVTTAPIAMQLFHLAIATATAFVVARWAPFPRVQRVLLAFGYFFFYEYAVISRDYAFSVLFLVCFCAAYGTRRRTYLGLACLLFLLAQTSVHGLIIAIALAGGLLLEACCDRSVRALLRTRKLEVTLSAVIVLCGFAACVAQVVPPADSGIAPPWRTMWDGPHVERALAAIWRGYVPVPGWTHQFWNTNIVDALSWQAALSVCVFCAGLVCFCRQRIVLAVYFGGTAGLVLFAYMVYPGYVRHHGHLYLLFVACMWLVQVDRSGRVGRSARPADAPRWQWHSRYRVAVFAGLLSVQVAAGLIAAGRDWRHPFTASKEAAAFIEDEGLADHVIIGDAGYIVQGVAGYLDREMYHTMSRRFGTFVVWSDERRFPCTRVELVEIATRMSAERQADVLLVLSYGLNRPEYPVVEIGRFGDTMVWDERFWVYVVEYDGVRDMASRDGLAPSRDGLAPSRDGLAPDGSDEPGRHDDPATAEARANDDESGTPPGPQPPVQW